MPIVLTARPAADPTEENKVRKLAGARHAPADWTLRARIITASWDGARTNQIATALGCHPKTIRLWLHRFNTAGLDGLADRPIPGRPRRLTETDRSRLLDLARSTPPGRPEHSADGALATTHPHGPPTWTLNSLTETARAHGIDIRRSQVRTILLAEGVRWRRTRSWIHSRDPDFVGKERGSSSSTPTRRRTPRSSVPTSLAR